MKIKNPFSKLNILILTPLILVMVLDLVFTLAGQPESYWQGNYLHFNEASPLGALLLPIHPAYFVLSFAFYIPFVLFLATNLARPLNIMVAIGFFLGHSWGSSSWVPIVFYKVTKVYTTDTWYLIIGYLIIIAIISGFCVNKWLKINKGRGII